MTEADADRAARPQQLEVFERALRKQRQRDEHTWNCRVPDCRECADLLDEAVDLRCEALGDLRNDQQPSRIADMEAELAALAGRLRAVHPEELQEAPTCPDHGTMVADDEMGRSWHCAACVRISPQSVSEFEAAEARLRAVHEELAAAQKRADANTDETCVAWHRDMAARFAEDRDVQKHRARELDAQLRAVEVQRDTAYARIEDLVKLAYTDPRTQLRSWRDAYQDAQQGLWTLTAQIEVLQGRVRAMLVEMRADADAFAETAMPSEAQIVHQWADKLSAILPAAGGIPAPPQEQVTDGEG